jgi:very-short-patch-repair endonuclease
MDIDFVSALFAGISVWWPIFLLAAIVMAFVLVVGLFFGKKERDLSVYLRRKYLFDSASEFQLFKLLIEMYQDRFHVFPQVHYSHLIEVRKDLTYRERISYWNSINRKSADFVLCDREEVVPQLVIELDGSSHKWDKRRERDEFIDSLLKQAGLPILHIKTDNLNREFVRTEIERVLTQ